MMTRQEKNRLRRALIRDTHQAIRSLNHFPEDARLVVQLGPRVMPHMKYRKAKPLSRKGKLRPALITLTLQDCWLEKIYQQNLAMIHEHLVLDINPVAIPEGFDNAAHLIMAGRMFMTDCYGVCYGGEWYTATSIPRAVELAESLILKRFNLDPIPF